MRSFTVKEDHIGLAVREILCYYHTPLHKELIEMKGEKPTFLEHMEHLVPGLTEHSLL